MIVIALILIILYQAASDSPSMSSEEIRSMERDQEETPQNWR